MAKLSIIIPTLNEEEGLPRLLKSIKEQELKDLEIIVADAGSEDKTVEIAKNFGCRIAKGGLPSKGRNEGAKIAKGDLFLFLDSDVVLAKDCLKKALNEFKARKLAVASCVLKPITQEKIVNFLYFILYNLPVFLLENILPHATSFILVKKELHQKIGGFDEEIKLAEDHYYVREAAKIGKFGILRKSNIFVSSRRFEKEGWLKVAFKFCLTELYLTLLGPIKTDIFSYHFGSHNKESNQKGPKFLELFLGIPVFIIWVLFVFFAFLIGGLKNKIKKAKI